ncbi:MAG: class I SAM-dependent methyltransferase [Bryobacteraceae bacterium]
MSAVRPKRWSRLAEMTPGFLRRRLLYFETAIDDAVSCFAAGLPDGIRVLDAGAGESRHAPFFVRQRYISVDLGIGDEAWNYSSLNAVADLTSLPFPSGSFAACINIVTLEHVPEPACVIQEMARVLEPGGRLLVVAPLEWEVHQAPHDYFRYTRHGLERLFTCAGLAGIDVQPVGGYFRMMGRRLLNGLQFFAGGARWILFLPAAFFLVPPALVLPWLDFLDRDRNFTLGYICTARKPSG